MKWMAAPTNRRRGLAAVASLAAHILMFAVALWSMRTAGPSPEGRAVQVTLLPQLPLARSSVHSRFRQSSPRVASPSAIVAPTKPRVSPLAAIPSVGNWPVPNPETARGIRPMLRSDLGCEFTGFLKLSSEERQKCDEKFAHASDAPAPPFNADPHGLYAVDPNWVPYLARLPKNGCKPMAYARKSIGGAAPYVGFACGKQF
jgi:hypothetical protein